MVKIVQKDDPILRQTAVDVSLVEIKSAKLQKLLAKMSQALTEQEDGVALAAPQIGEAKRIFIIAGKMLSRTDSETETKTPAPDLVFINPKLLKTSRRKKNMEEGCLSVRWLYGTTKRANKATVEAYDQNGQKFIRHGTGLMAQIFQHEIDHLVGILFIDNATDIKEIKPNTNNNDE